MPKSPTTLQPSTLFNQDVPNSAGYGNKLEETNSRLQNDSSESFKTRELLEFEEKNSAVDIHKNSLKQISILLEKKEFSYSSESDSEVETPSSPIKIKVSGLFKNMKRKNSLATDSDSEMSGGSSIKILNKKDSPKSPISDALALREKNIKERDAFLASFLDDPEFAEAVKHIGLFQKNSNQSSTINRKGKKRRKHTDDSFRFTGFIPIQQRKSLRLQDKEPMFKYDNFIDETTFAHMSRKRKRSDLSDDDYEYSDLENVVYKPKNRSNNRTRATERTNFLHVEDVTESMLKNIAWRVSDKQYSTSGSSCHQCRQKTLDTKTFCRDKNCVGVKGQFCGVCLDNRYGENAATALKDPDWRCPVCRGICNCSFCRSKAGKRPTGVLAPMAHRTGHKSVKEFLDSLRGEGDYADETLDPKNLLGFSQDLNYANMGGDVKHFVGSSTDLVEFKKMLDLLNSKCQC